MKKSRVSERQSENEFHTHFIPMSARESGFAFAEDLLRELKESWSDKARIKAWCYRWSCSSGRCQSEWMDTMSNWLSLRNALSGRAWWARPLDSRTGEES